jgi:CRISPR/Cas system CSM-associated protein Csm3 (group 7 of RAMP superfamily)
MNEVREMKTTKKLIVVRAYTPIAKPLNASIQKNSTMLLLGEIPYINGGKTFNTKVYYIKGLRGMLRHAAMALAYDCGIEVCHTSEKTELKDGTKLMPVGFHVLGSCDPPCILQRIFGSFRKESRISVLADPITSISQKDYTTNVAVQKVHIASEIRIAMSFDGIPIQDFRESYFSGYFTFSIDVTQLTDVEIKFLLESLLYIETLGGGKNAGYGQVKLLDFDLLQVELDKTIKKDNESYKFVEEVKAESIVLDNIENWRETIVSLQT